MTFSQRNLSFIHTGTTYTTRCYMAGKYHIRNNSPDLAPKRSNHQPKLPRNLGTNFPTNTYSRRLFTWIRKLRGAKRNESRLPPSALFPGRDTIIPKMRNFSSGVTKKLLPQETANFHKLQSLARAHAGNDQSTDIRPKTSNHPISLTFSPTLSHSPGF